LASLTEVRHRQAGRVFISDQKRGAFGAIKRELRRRSAIEAAIGRMKGECDLGRCYLEGIAGNAADVFSARSASTSTSSSPG